MCVSFRVSSYAFYMYVFEVSSMSYIYVFSVSYISYIRVICLVCVCLFVRLISLSYLCLLCVQRGVESRSHRMPYLCRSFSAKEPYN